MIASAFSQQLPNPLLVIAVNVEELVVSAKRRVEMTIRPDLPDETVVGRIGKMQSPKLAKLDATSLWVTAGW